LAERRTTARTWLSLVAIALAAFALGTVLRNVGPVGTDISQRTSLASIKADHTSPSSGPREARIALVVFTDYQCPACRAAHDAMHRAVRDAGDVRIIYRDLPIFGPVSERAARVALAARNQGLYGPVHDGFMRDPRRLDDPVMRAIVEREGGNWQQIERDLATDPAIGRQLQVNQADALRLGVAGTPTYLIGSYRIAGALDEEGFAKAFEQARSDAEGEFPA